MAHADALRLAQPPLAALPCDRGFIPAIAADGSLFPIAKMDAHRLGTYHKAVSVFVFSGDELLIQKRAAGKYHCGRQWANTCCTHPYWGEGEHAAADRRLREELGVSVGLVPTAILSYTAEVTDGLVENELVQVFRGAADKAQLQIDPDPAEVEEVRWVAPESLLIEMQRRPQDFTPWFRIYLARWPALGL